MLAATTERSGCKNLSEARIKQEDPQQEWRNVVIEKRRLPALWSFAIDDDGDSVYSRLHRLTRAFQVSTLWHRLARL